MKWRYAREIRRGIAAARGRSKFPYRFIPGHGFEPTESLLFMRAFRRAGGDNPPRNAPIGPSGVSRP